MIQVNLGAAILYIIALVVLIAFGAPGWAYGLWLAIAIKQYD